MIQKGNPSLYIFTQGYPYSWSSESIFIEHELECLIKVGYEVTIFPLRIGNERVEVKGYTIDASLAELLDKDVNSARMYFIAAFRMLLNLKKNWARLGRGINAFFRMYKYALSIESKKRVLECFFHERMDKSIIFYTYWCTDFSSALAEILKEKRHFGLISRAHGVDLYEERGKVFFREETLSNLNRLIVPSKYGLNYLKQSYPTFTEKYHFAPLGVRIIELEDLPILDGFKLVSCSNVDNNKRVIEVFVAMIEFSKKHSDANVHWTHFGNGPLLGSLRTMVANCKISNLIVDIRGNVSNQEVLDYYQTYRIDAFITFSRSEGGRPVSVQEAMSFGIPVLASANEGLIETVDGSNGKLVSEPLNIERAALLLSDLVHENRKSSAMRNYTYEFAKKHFDRDIHTMAFIEYISRIK